MKINQEVRYVLKASIWKNMLQICLVLEIFMLGSPLTKQMIQIKAINNNWISNCNLEIMLRVS